MIIVPNDSSSSSDIDKRDASLKLATNRFPSPAPLHDLPPSYNDIRILSTISPEPAPNRPCPVPNIKPSNFVSLSRPNGSIKGSWLIDPSLFIPSSFLPPLHPAEGDRRNLYLESKNGSIDADVYLQSTSHSNKNTSKYILIHTQSQNGSVKTRLHDTRSLNGEVRLPVRLSTCSANGTILVHLPRSFRGPFRIRTINGSVHFSPAIQAYLTPFSEMGGMQRSFLGHFNPSHWEIETPWEGDELSIDAKNGSVKIFFDDETDARLVQRGQSFFSRVFALQ